MTLRRGRALPGQAVLELALVSVVLLSLVMGVVDFGRALYAHVIVTQAAKDGARKGAVYPNCRSSVTDYASIPTPNLALNTTYNSIDYAVANSGSRLALGSSNITVQFYSYDSATGVRTAAVSPAAGGQIDVQVSFPFSPMTPLVGPILGSPTIVGSATHVIESTPSGC